MKDPLFMKQILILLSFVGSLFLISSCKKVEGPGGSSTITGKIYIKKYDTQGNVVSEYFAPKEDVFLIYGDSDTFYDDDVKTSYEGTFEFRFLQKGNYRVFVYEKCPTCPSGKQVIIRNAEIKSNKSTVDLGTIEIAD